MALDRIFQRQILLELSAHYPFEQSHYFDPRGDTWKIQANVAYLKEHGLMKAGSFINCSRGYSALMSITAAGLDFMEDDGGISAILNTITVKLHADTIRDLLTKKIDDADLPAEEKSDLRKAVEGLPAAALTAGATDLVKMGLDHAPGGLAAIRTLFGLG